jgi:hypothetical protein
MTDVANAQNSTGNDTLEERLKSLEREKRGILDDLKNERQQRQAYEKRLEDLEKTLNSAANEPEVNDPQSEVNRLAQQPKEYIVEVVKPLIEEAQKEIRELKIAKQFDRAYTWLAKQEKKDVDDLYGSDIEKEIVRIFRDHGMTVMDPVDGTKAAYKIYQQEQRLREEEEAKRNQTISANSTHAVRSPSSSGSPVWTRDRINEVVRNGEWEKYREEILTAQKSGRITQ